MLSQKQNCQQVLVEQPIENTQQIHIPYRKDIDGLRAVAIIAVLIFHAWPQFLPGGFIGVDIFFVISGYLITKIILKDNYQEKFSYWNFYNRRIKRIYPALILILVFVLIVGVNIFDKRSLKIMTSTMAASTLFGANIQLLLLERVYFDPVSQKNPLLHLWSLGVQEQFYIIWPILISLFTLKFRTKVFTLLAIFTFFSFLSSVIVSYCNIKMDFYFPFCRFWQMAIGGLLNYDGIKINNKKIVQSLPLIGLGMILTFVWILNESVLFPGWRALIPTLASAFIIVAGNQSFINKNILGSKPMIFIGKISYSLYLWHWPLLVLFKSSYPLGSTSIFSNTFFIVAIAIILSLLSYYVIEDPFRKNKSKAVFLGLLIVMLLIGVTSFYIRMNIDSFGKKFTDQQMKKYQNQMTPTQLDFYTKNGKKQANLSKNKHRIFPILRNIEISIHSRQDDTQLTFLQKKVTKESKFYKQNIDYKNINYQVANQGKQNLLLIVGDSHARFASYRLGKIYSYAKKSNSGKHFPSIVYISLNGRILIPSQDGYEFIIEWIEQFKPDRIIFVYRWLHNWFLENGKTDLKQGRQSASDQNFYKNIAHFHHVIKSLTQTGIQIVVATTTPQGKEFNPLNMYDVNGMIQKNFQPIKLSAFRQKNKSYIQFFQQGIVQNGGQLIDLSDNLCWKDICQVFTPTGYPAYQDDDHLKPMIAKQWLTVVDGLVQF